MLISSIAVVGFVIYLTSNYFVSVSTNAHLTRIQSTDFPILKIVNDTSIAIGNMKTGFSSAVDTGEKLELDSTKMIYRKTIQGLQEISVLSPDVRNQVENILFDLQVYYEASHTVASGMLSDSIGTDELLQLVPIIDSAAHALENKLKKLRTKITVQFAHRLESVRINNRQAWRTGAMISFAIVTTLVFFSVYITNMLTHGLNHAMNTADKIADGDWTTEINIDTEDETGHLLKAISTMRDKLKDRTEEDHRKERLQSQIAESSARMQGDPSLEELCLNIIEFAASTTHCHVGTLYLYDPKSQKLHQKSNYAYVKQDNKKTSYDLGESLVGQCAREKKQIYLRELPNNYMEVSSSLGSAPPHSILLTPILYDSQLVAVIELGSMGSIEIREKELLDRISDNIGIAINSALSRIQIANMLEQTQEQAISMKKQQLELQNANTGLEKQAVALKESDLRMQSQQEQLRTSNQELQQQTDALITSEKNMLLQQEKLELTNDELAEQAMHLEQQKESFHSQNIKLEKAQEVLRTKSKDLEASNKYKSEFLSTMSHELRTPLNCILLLSKSLSENRKNNLIDKQIEHCEVIHSAGTDLLALINDILDLSKVEEGKLQIVLEDLPLDIIKRNIQFSFEHLASEKNLEFEINIAENLPNTIRTDRQRVEQILKNLLSNAFKFTQSGGVYFDISRPSRNMLLNKKGLNPTSTLALTVRDTGIGIKKDKQSLVFEAFKQADGTTSRNFGGTGLGLSISKKLTGLLHGDLSITSSDDGMGSSFTLLLPEHVNIEGAQILTPPPLITKKITHDIVDNTNSIVANETKQELTETTKHFGFAAIKQHETATVPHVRKLLVVDDDVRNIYSISAILEENNFEIEIAKNGQQAIDSLNTAQDKDLILMDIMMPGMDGIEALHRIRKDPRFSSLPIIAFTAKASDDDREICISAGANDYITKPIDPDKLLAKINSWLDHA
ncbi:MAG: response regulator [Pseudomonadales bacterium]|nr:response regulator [Pseudomonadales bacterium]